MPVRLALCETLLGGCKVISVSWCREDDNAHRATQAAKNVAPLRKDVPEGEVPSLQQNFSILLPHFQQHVKQLGHGEAVALQTEQTVVSKEERREAGRRAAVSLTLHHFAWVVLLAAHRALIIFPNPSRHTHLHPLLPPCLYPHPPPIFTSSCQSNFYHTHIYTEANKYKMGELLQIDRRYAKGWVKRKSLSLEIGSRPFLSYKTCFEAV